MQSLAFLKKYVSHPIAKNVGWQSISSFFRAFFALISAALLTRYFGPEQYGAYSFILALSGIFIIFNRGGTDGVTLNLLTKYPKDRKEIFGSIMAWRYICWLSGFVIFSFIVAQAGEDKYWYAFLIYIFLIFSPADILDNFFQAQYKNKYYILPRILLEAFALLAKAVCVFQGYGLVYFIYIICAQNVLYSFIIVSVYWAKEGLLPRIGFSKDYFIRIVKESFPLIFAAFMVSFYTQVDQIMLSHIAGDKALGFYSPSAQITTSVFALSVIFAHPIQVKFMEIKKAHPDYDRWMLYYLSMITKLSFLISVSVCLTAPFMLPILIGDSFDPTTSILMVQIWACVFAFQGAIRNREIINSYKSYYILLCVTCGALVNVALNLMLIKDYQGLGASIATVISLMISSYLTSWIIPELRAFAKLQTKALYCLNIRAPEK